MGATVRPDADQSSTSAHSRRERNRRRTRGAIIAATLALVDRRGYDAVTIEMIAEAADVSPRTISNYFSGKEEAFFASEPELAEPIREAFRGQPADAPLLATLRGVLGAIAGDIASRAPHMDIRLAALRVQPRLAPAFRARFSEVEAVMSEQIAARLHVAAETDRRPRLLAGMLVVSMRGSLEHWRSGDRLDDLPSMVTTSFDVLLKTLLELG